MGFEDKTAVDIDETEEEDVKEMPSDTDKGTPTKRMSKRHHGEGYISY